MQYVDKVSFRIKKKNLKKSGFCDSRHSSDLLCEATFVYVTGRIPSLCGDQTVPQAYGPIGVRAVLGVMSNHDHCLARLIQLPE